MLNANLEKFRNLFDLKNVDSNTSFEIYINQLFARHNRFFDCMSEYNRFDLSNVGGGDDSGIDGIFIKINGQLIYSKDDIDSVIKSGSLLLVEYIFIQTKNKTNIDVGELSKFFSGIKNFMKDGALDNVNSKIEEWLDLKKYLNTNDILTLYESEPKINAYYCYKGVNLSDKHVASKIKEFKDDIKLLGCSSEPTVIIFDGEKIFNLIKKVENNFKKTIPYYDSFELKDAENVSSSLVLLCAAKDIVDLLTDDEDGQLKREIFSDNVRDYQGDTAVNREIFDTISQQPASFCLLNNGITIVCDDCISTNRKITLSNPQIVNGCQTCTTLFNANKKGLDIDEIDIIVKVIATNNSFVTNSIIKGTNRQNVVYSESFEITREFHKKLEDYIKSIQTLIPADEKIYYERRSKQLSDLTNIKESQKFNLTVLTQSYVSTFLVQPHCGFEHVIDLLDKFKNDIFRNEDNFKSYYVSALLFLMLDKEFKRNYDDYKFYGRYKYQVMAIYIHLVAGRVPDLENSNKVDSYCDKLLLNMHNKELFSKSIKESVSKFDFIKEQWILTKGEKFIHSIKDNHSFDDFMFKQLGFIYANLSKIDKEEDNIYVGIVSTVKKDRNGMHYCYIKADPVDVFVHEDKSPGTIFTSLAGKKVKYKIISTGRFNNPNGKIIKVFPRNLNGGNDE